MQKSMTGYGAYQGRDKICFQNWEIKSVNAKHLSLRWMVPSFLQSQEQLWSQKVREFAVRGRLEISLDLRLLQKDLVPVHLDLARAGAMLDQLQELAREQSQKFVPDLNRLLHIPALWQEQEAGLKDELHAVLLAGLEQALQDWEQARQEEGRSLSQDLLQRVLKMKDWIQDLQGLTRNLAREKLHALQERLTEIIPDTGLAFDEQRLLQELALLADKADVSEELTRLQNHLDTLHSFLDSAGAGGRKMDFMLQECFREINTCGNKAQDVNVSRLVVEFKAELEKCREQVQNLE